MPDLMIRKNHRLIREDIITQNNGYRVSEKYKPIPTQSVLDIVKDVKPDYKIIGFNNSGVRSLEKDSYQKHALMIEFDDAMMLDGTSMNLVIFNSSDRSMSLRLIAGSIRAVCSNNIVWGDTIMPELRIRHTKEEWQHSVRSLMDNFQKVQDETQRTIDAMMNRYMSYGDMGRFAEKVAYELIEPNITGSLVDPMELLVSQRPEDHHKTLWSTFNKAQEYMSKGGLKRIIMKEPEDGENQGRLIETISNTHKITNEAKRIKLNKELSEMALELL